MKITGRLARLRGLRWDLACAWFGHEWGMETVLPTKSYAWGDHPSVERFTYFGTCGRCGQFGGQHHHDRATNLEDRKTCWIHKQWGETDGTS